MRIDEIREWAQKAKERADALAERAEQTDRHRNARYWCGFSDAMSRLPEQLDVPSSTEEDE